MSYDSDYSCNRSLRLESVPQCHRIMCQTNEVPKLGLGIPSMRPTVPALGLSISTIPDESMPNIASPKEPELPLRTRQDPEWVYGQRRRVEPILGRANA